MSTTFPKRGDWVVVMLSVGTQVARVEQIGHRLDPEAIVVRKWRHASKRWTGRTTVRREQITGRPVLGDSRYQAALLSLPGDQR